LPDIIEHVVAL